MTTETTTTTEPCRARIGHALALAAYMLFLATYTSCGLTKSLWLHRKREELESLFPPGWRRCFVNDSEVEDVFERNLLADRRVQKIVDEAVLAIFGEDAKNRFKTIEEYSAFWGVSEGGVTADNPPPIPQLGWYETTTQGRRWISSRLEDLDDYSLAWWMAGAPDSCRAEVARELLRRHAEKISNGSPTHSWWRAAVEEAQACKEVDRG